MSAYINEMLQTWQSCDECGKRIPRKELALVIEMQCDDCNSVGLQFYHPECIKNLIKTHEG